MINEDLISDCENSMNWWKSSKNVCTNSTNEKNDLINLIFEFLHRFWYKDWSFCERKRYKSWLTKLTTTLIENMIEKDSMNDCENSINWWKKWENVCTNATNEKNKSFISIFEFFHRFWYNYWSLYKRKRHISRRVFEMYNINK